MPLALAVFFWLVATVTVGIFLARVWWLPELVSRHGAAIDAQLILTLTVAGAVFFLAQAALGYLVWRYRGRGGARAASWHENSRLEATWTVATAILFLGLGVLGNRVWAGYLLSQTPADATMIEVTAQQFAWNIRYAGPDGRFGRTDPRQINDALGNFIGLDPNDPAGADDIVAQNIIAVPVNRPVRVMLRSKDVTHAFYVPQMRIKQDAVPGMVIGINFTPAKTGEYEVACAELCGMQHYKMRARMLVMQEAEFHKWLKSRS
jgi:cytochrome c oxidase subunit 2